MTDVICPLIPIDKKKFYEGTVFSTKDGNKVEILKYVDDGHVRYKFVDSGYTSNTTLKSILSGTVKYPHYLKERYKGKIITNIKGDKYTIINIYGDKADIQFLDSGFIMYNVEYKSARMGAIRNPFSINKYGGYTGIGFSSTFMNEVPHGIWNGMISRAGNPEYKKYVNVSVDERWFDFQNFINWYIPKIVRLNPTIHYNLDKDLRQLGKEHKVYGPDTCSLLPAEVNLNLICLEDILLGKKTGIFARPSKISDNVRYSASVSINDKSKLLGTYDTEEEALYVYRLNRLVLIKRMIDNYYNMGALLVEDYYYMNDVLQYIGKLHSIDYIAHLYSEK